MWTEQSVEGVTKRKQVKKYKQCKSYLNEDIDAFLVGFLVLCVRQREVDLTRYEVQVFGCL